MKLFTKAQKKLFGGEWSYIAGLSSKTVLRFGDKKMLPQGTWALVVMRPDESLFKGDATTATIKLTAL